jgi:hypothetical protein
MPGEGPPDQVCPEGVTNRHTQAGSGHRSALLVFKRPLMLAVRLTNPLLPALADPSFSDSIRV